VSREKKKVGNGTCRGEGDRGQNSLHYIGSQPGKRRLGTPRRKAKKRGGEKDSRREKCSFRGGHSPPRENANREGKKEPEIDDPFDIAPSLKQFNSREKGSRPGRGTFSLQKIFLTGRARKGGGV